MCACVRVRVLLRYSLFQPSIVFLLEITTTLHVHVLLVQVLYIKGFSLCIFPTHYSSWTYTCIHVHVCPCMSMYTHEWETDKNTSKLSRTESKIFCPCALHPLLSSHLQLPGVLFRHTYTRPLLQTHAAPGLRPRHTLQAPVSGEAARCTAEGMWGNAEAAALPGLLPPLTHCLRR